MKGTSIISYFIIILALVYSFTYPDFYKVKDLYDQKSEYQNLLDQIHGIESRKNNLLAEYNNISNRDLKNIETFIPDSLNLVKLAADIDSVASRHGASIKSFTSTGKDDFSPDSLAEAGTPRKYKFTLVEMNIDASYANFNNLLDELERSLRVIDIKSLSIDPNENNVYSFDIKFETYWSNNSNENI